MSDRVTPRERVNTRKWARTVRRRVQILPLVLLTVFWVMLWGTLSLGNILFGIIVAVVVLMFFPLPPLALGVRLHPWDFLVLSARFTWDLIKASVQIAVAAVRPGFSPHGRVIRVPLLSDNELIAVVNAEMNALVPGSIVIDLRPSEKWMLLHIFHAPDDEALRKAFLTARGQEVRVIKALASNRASLLRDPYRLTGQSEHVAARSVARAPGEGETS